ncbi:MAG: hypothetical protein A2V98_05675 [Planctomycetes bacterium RBG_16_64_12]|nr:MAG: hypothetical protein A2V98_05675 [Planctomycetes bacterium RBG_16_64_12]
MLGLTVAASLFLAGTAARGTQEAQYQPGTPFTYLFDTGSPSPRLLSARAISAKDGWTLVPEDDTEHTFRGDAVLLNDKLSVVLRAKGPGAEVYSQTTGKAKFRAVVMAADRTAVSVQGTSSVRIVENSPGAVELEATFQTDGATGRFSVGYRLTTGEAMLEMTGGPSAERFFVWCKTRYVVVPDFFGDDMVFTAATGDLSRFGLPAENFFLSLIEGGDSIMMCVWPSRRQDAHAILTGEGAQRVIRGCEVQGGEGSTLSVALLDTANIWHEEVPTEERVRRGRGIDWRPPFDAKWRVDRPSAGPFTVSSDLSKAQLENSGPPPRDAIPTPTIVYPLDRTVATPLAAVCPIDVLRSTLGVGPCQYILQTEGLASDSNPTPDHVISWVERQFAKHKEGEAADEIKEQLAQMSDHVRHAQARIDRYAAFGREVQTLLKTEEARRGESEAARGLSDTVAYVARTADAGRRTHEPAERAAGLADAIVRLIGREESLAECQRLGLEVRRIGAEQDRTLSTCRMAVRWLKVQARMCVIRDPGSAELAKEIQARAERFLNEK